ncbi:MAG TPA: hypothetical protein VLX28_14520 [Thermoanaerobaculia bacterium]|nr:hypothetical protein [Thermoanaerobaculia bacterium]
MASAAVLTFFAGLLSAQLPPKVTASTARQIDGLQRNGARLAPLTDFRFVKPPNVTGTMTVSGTFTPGSTVTYIVTLTNNGGATQPDNPGPEFVDILPARVTLLSATASFGSAVATAGTNTVTWNGSIPPASSSTLGIKIIVKLPPPTCIRGLISLSEIVSNQGSIYYDADANGTNEATSVTDDPSTAAPDDPTSFTVPVPSTVCVSVTGTKTVSGNFTPGGTITYTIVLTNSGVATQGDNPGNELTDVLPSTLALVNATATSGTAVATTGTNTVTWNGSIPAGGSVTITITATVLPAAAGQTISNQGTFSYDSDGDGTNDATSLTDDPATPVPGDPTSVTVPQSVVETPTLSGIGLALLGLALAGAALLVLRRRQPA